MNLVFCLTKAHGFLSRRPGSILLNESCSDLSIRAVEPWCSDAVGNQRCHDLGMEVLVSRCAGNRHHNFPAMEAGKMQMCQTTSTSLLMP